MRHSRSGVRGHSSRTPRAPSRADALVNQRKRWHTGCASRMRGTAGAVSGSGTTWRPKAVLALAAIGAVAGLTAGHAQAAKLPSQIWAIQLPGKTLVSAKYLKDVKATGANAVIVDPSGFSKRLRSQIATSGSLALLVRYPAGEP